TFNVAQVSSSALSSTRGFQLPPLLVKGQIRPEQLANVRFRLVEVDAQPLSDQQFNALIKRLVKCFMSEVEITKRMRKITSRRFLLPGNKQLIRHMEALRRNYETERSGLVVQLSRDCRFRPYANLTPQSAMKASGKFSKARKSKSLEIISKSCDVPEVSDPDECTSRQRQSGGFQPIICNRIVTPAGLTKRLREKLYRLQEIAKYRPEPSISDESMTTFPGDTGALAKSSSSDVFYDMDNF
ncbi:hypothetical protein KR059_012254, partial [Drosophila kikkawai]